MDWREHIVCDPGILCGKPTLKGTRLSVEFVLNLLAGGWTHDDIESNYPNLTNERVHAVLAYAAALVHEKTPPAMSSSSEELPIKQLRMRLPEGIKLADIPNLSYMLQLMACLEAINSALRWLGLTEHYPSLSTNLDKFLVWNVGAGWCAEAFRRLQQGRAENRIDPNVLEGNEHLLALWNRITADKPDELISKIHRIRDKHFGHFDAEVMTKFIALQDRIGATEPFFLGDETGHPLNCRFLWPTAASIFDIFPDPTDRNRSQKVEKLLDDLKDIWAQTTNLLMTLLEAWVVKCGFDFQVSEW